MEKLARVLFRVAAMLPPGLLLLCSDVSALGSSPPELADASTALRQLNEQLGRRASVILWLDAADPTSAGLSFAPGPQQGNLRTLPGPWDGQTAMRLFHGTLSGGSVHIPDTGWTVVFWLRYHDLERADLDGEERTSGGVMAVGSGWMDGWRITLSPGSGEVTFSVGRPETGAASVAAYGAVADGEWHHVACTWDGSLARIHLDGVVQSEGIVEAPYTVPPNASGLRFGECSYGLGAMDYAIADVGIFAEVLPDALLENLGAPPRVFEQQLARRLGRASQLAEEANGRPRRERRVREAYALLTGLEERRGAEEAARIVRARAHLGTGDSFGREQRHEDARRSYQALADDDRAPEHLRTKARFDMAALLTDQRRYADARRAYAALRDEFTGKHEHYRVEAIQRLADLADLPDGTPFRDLRTRRIERLNGASMRFHVSPRGDDAADGTRQGPFRTLERARAAIRELKQAGGLPAGGVAVELAGGVYERTAPFELDENDSGTPDSPVIYQAARGERVVLRGGRTVSGFVPLAHPTGLARIPKAAQDHVMQLDLRGAGITDLGSFHPRGYGRSDPVPAHLELFCDGLPMPLARWPNESRRMADGFTTVQDLIGENVGEFVGKTIDRTNGFVYGDPRHAGWQDEPEILLYGYWTRMYAGSYLAVASIDAGKGQLRIADPMPPYKGFIKGGPYYAINVLRELDSPGEWYLDKESGTLFFWPPSPLEMSEVVVSLLEAPLLSLREASHLAFRGLTLEATRGDGVTITGGEGVILAGCVLRDLGVSGVIIDGGRDHVVIGCDIEHVGDAGVLMEGGDVATLTGSGHVVENCHIHHFDRWNRAGYKAGVCQDGVGTRISHCLIHDAPHQAIKVTENDHILEYTEIHDTCYEAGEMGSYYMYGSNRVLGERGQLVRYNYWHDLSWDETYNGFAYTGRHALHVDHMNGDITLFGNVFERCATRSGAFFSGGPDNTVENNLFRDCAVAINLHDRSWVYDNVNQAPEYALDAYLQTMAVDQPPWSVRYPRLQTFPRQATDLSVFLVGNRITRNISVKCDQFLSGAQKTHDLARIEGNWRSGDPGFRDESPADLRLRPDSPVFVTTGYEPIPFERIGLYNDELRATWPVEHAHGNHENVVAAQRTKAKLPVCRALPLQGEVVVDGRLTPEEWDGLDRDRATPLVRRPDDQPAVALPSYAWIRRDNTHLYIAALHEVPPDVPLQTGDIWWGGDMMEIIFEGQMGVGTGGWWLDEKPHGPLFYLVGDTTGKFGSISIEGLPKLRAERLRNAVQYATRSDTPGQWTAEWRIPLALMCIDPAQTEFCNFNIGVRKMATQPKPGTTLRGNDTWTVWAGALGSNWQVWNAGRLQLR